MWKKSDRNVILANYWNKNLVRVKIGVRKGIKMQKCSYFYNKNR